jgi:hypothetical protein
MFLAVVTVVDRGGGLPTEKAYNLSLSNSITYYWESNVVLKRVES